MSSKEVRKIARELEALALRTPLPKRKRRPARQPAAQNAGAGRKRRNRNQRRAKNAIMNCDSGAIRVRRCEYLMECKGKTTGEISSAVMAPTTTVMPWLGNIAKAYSRITWHSATLIYKPAVGTTIDGEVVVAVDWDESGTAPDNKAKVYQFSPCADGPVWRPVRLPLPSDQLMSRREYLHHSTTVGDKGPGIVYVALPKADKVYGSLWVQYDVTLKGTQSPN